MGKLKKGDFVEIEYTGVIKEDKTLFDTTDESKAKELKIHNPNMTYGPVAICIGEYQVIKGIDDQLVDKETNNNYTLEIKPEDAFGKKNPKLLKIVSISIFRKQNITPMIGLQVTIDGVLGTVRSVTSGRVVLDFNHPLSGRDLVYYIKVYDVITDKKKQLESYIKLSLGLKEVEITLENDEAKATLLMELPQEAKDKLTKRVLELIKIKKIDFLKKEESKKEEKKEQPKPAEKK